MATAPAHAPVKSQPLHNFALPFLKWGASSKNNTTTASAAPPTPTPAPIASDPEPRATDSHSLSNHRHHHNCTKPNTTTQTTPCRSHGNSALASPRFSPRPQSRSAPDLPETTTTPPTTENSTKATAAATTTTPHRSCCGSAVEGFKKGFRLRETVEASIKSWVYTLYKAYS
ncbi:hypothetical protein JHK85_007254 [Glycine max]|nr:hypothetical protein JHK85_007254 [Glycine max]